MTISTEIRQAAANADPATVVEGLVDMVSLIETGKEAVCTRILIAAAMIDAMKAYADHATARYQEMERRFGSVPR